MLCPALFVCVCVCLVCFVCVNVCIYFYVLRAHSPSVSVLQTGVNLNLPLVGTVDIYDSLTNTMCVISCDAHNSATYKQTSCPVLYTHTHNYIYSSHLFSDTYAPHRAHALVNKTKQTRTTYLTRTIAYTLQTSHTAPLMGRTGRLLMEILYRRATLQPRSPSGPILSSSRVRTRLCVCVFVCLVCVVCLLNVSLCGMCPHTAHTGGLNATQDGVLKSVQAYNLVTRSWSTLPDLDTAVANLGASAIENDAVMFAGGYAGTRSGTYYVSIQFCAHTH